MTPEELLGEARDLLREYVVTREGWTKTSAGRWKNDLGHTLDLGPAYLEARRRPTAPVAETLEAASAVQNIEHQLAHLGQYRTTLALGEARWRAPTFDGELYTVAGAADRVVADAKRRAADAPPAEPVVDRADEWNQAPTGGV